MAASSSSSASGGKDVSDCSYLDQIVYRSPSTDTEPIIIFSIAALSTVPDSVTDEALFESLMERCALWVGDEGETRYTLMILAAEGEVSKRARGNGFWVWRFRRIPRSFRKNLKRMYIVHPTRFTRTILQVVLPFLSPKSYRKIYPLDSILLLPRLHGESLAGLHLAIPLLLDEARTMTERPDLFPLAHKRPYPGAKNEPTGWFAGLRGIVGAAAGYLPYGSQDLAQPAVFEGCYGQSAEDLVQAFGGVPPAMAELRDVVISLCSKTEGIFRGTPEATLRPPLIALLNLPPSSQPIYPWASIARYDPFLPPKLLMRIFSSSPSPYIPSEVYPVVRKIRSPADIRTLLFPALSPARVTLMSHMIRTLHDLSMSHEVTTRMTARNYAICFAPDLIRGEDPVEDLEMCLEPGRKLPAALDAQRKLDRPREEGDCSLVAVLEMWIKDYGRIEGDLEGM